MWDMLRSYRLETISTLVQAVPGTLVPLYPKLRKLVDRFVRIGATGGEDRSFEGRGAIGKTRPVGWPPSQSNSPSEFKRWWGAIGCFVSHAYLWERVGVQLREGRYLILEDDAVLREGWRERLSEAFEGGHVPDDWDILYLFNSCLKCRETWPPWRGKIVNKYVAKLGPARDNARNLGTVAYLVRGGSDRMRRMTSAIRSAGALNIDVSINLRMDVINAYLLLPSTTTSPDGGNLIAHYYAGGQGFESTIHS
eukprot:g4200.t1